MRTRQTCGGPRESRGWVRQGGANTWTSTEKKKSYFSFFSIFTCTGIFLFQLRVLVLVGFCGYCGAGVSFGVSVRIARMGGSGRHGCRVRACGGGEEDDLLAEDE